MTITNTTYTVTVESRSGIKSIQTALTPQEAIQVLADQKNPSNFARDLVHGSARYGLSANQLKWAIVLAQECLNKQAKPEAIAAPALANHQAIFNLFATAHLNLKYPRLRLQTKDGRLVVIKLSGQRSSHCGSLNLTNGVKYGEHGAIFFGYVHQDGGTTVSDLGVLELLQSLANDPAGLAASQGLASGDCCFCGRSLSDSEAGSSEIGYGKTCSRHYGLPWQPNTKANQAKKVKRTKKVAVTA